MALGKWKKISTEVVLTNPWWTYKIDDYYFPNGNKGKYYYAFTYGSVFIVPVTDNGKILMVNQYRYLNDRFSIEFPGGGIKKGEEPLFSARKELIEETGFDGEIEKIGFHNPFNGVTNEICQVYIARNLKPSNEFIKDDSEEFELGEYTADEIEEMILSNEIYDGMSLATWALVRRKLNLKASAG